MNKKVVIPSVLAAILALVVVFCVYWIQSLKEKERALEARIKNFEPAQREFERWRMIASDNKRDLDYEEEKTKMLIQKLGELNRELNKTKFEFMNIKSQNEDFFAVYEHEYYVGKKIKSFIPVARQSSIKEKLQSIGLSLSKQRFKNNKIEILDLSEKGGKLTAIVNLQDDETKPKKPYEKWYDYFQGSSGGAETWVTLVYTFLQPDYQGKWIDQLVFYENGKPIVDVYDHIDLSGKFLRKDHLKY